MEKTIKEIADELGLSKDKVKYRVSKLPNNYLVKKEGVIYVKSEGIKEIFNILGEKCLGNYSVNSLQNSQSEKLIEVLQKELEVLNKQLDEKDRQLVVKDNQIDEYNKQLEKAHKLIDQEQQLRMVSEQKLLSLEEKNETNKERGFFSRIFKS